MVCSMPVSNFHPLAQNAVHGRQHASIMVCSMPACCIWCAACRYLQHAGIFSMPVSLLTSTPSPRVSCMVCGVPVSARFINRHLDACLVRDTRATASTSESRVKQPTTQRRPLPKLVYHMLSDKELRKTLSNASLSTTGTRESLIKRHKKYFSQCCMKRK